MCVWGRGGLRVAVSVGVQVNLMGSKSIYVSDMNWIQNTNFNRIQREELRDYSNNLFIYFCVKDTHSPAVSHLAGYSHSFRSYKLYSFTSFVLILSRPYSKGRMFI